MHYYYLFQTPTYEESVLNSYKSAEKVLLDGHVRKKEEMHEEHVGLVDGLLRQREEHYQRFGGSYVCVI